MQADGDLVGTTTDKISAPVSAFSDPAVFHAYSLISTDTANSIEAILSKFPDNLGAYIKTALAQLENANLITYENGTYKATQNNIFNKVTTEEHATIYPDLFSGAVKAVARKINSGAHIKNVEDFDLYYVSDNPQTRAEIKALTTYVDKEMKRIIDNAKTTDSSAVRIFGYVNSLPKAEDFL